jgi:hypothetical protein
VQYTLQEESKEYEKAAVRQRAGRGRGGGFARWKAKSEEANLENSAMREGQFKAQRRVLLEEREKETERKREREGGVNRD